MTEYRTGMDSSEPSSKGQSTTELGEESPEDGSANEPEV